MQLSSKIFALVIVVVSYIPFSQAANITGTVKGPDGAPFEGAFVQARNAGTKITVSVLSGKDGRYHIEDLGAGDYQLQIRASGYKSEPRSGVKLTSDQNASFDFALQKGMVRWSDLSVYQAGQLFPEATGKQVLFRKCVSCHGYQTKMATRVLNEDGWRPIVNHMQTSMHYLMAAGGSLPEGGPFSDQDAADVTSYLAKVFGPDSILPRSPADLPAYASLVRHFSDEAMKIVYVEYEVPDNRAPWSAFPDKTGETVWIPYYGDVNKIARLDTKTGEVQEFPVPNRGTAAIHSAVPAPDGTVWLAEQGANKLGKWDPRTRTITEYQDPYIPGLEGVRAGGEKHTVRISPQGQVWVSGRPLSRFDPETQKFTHFPELPYVYQVELDQQGNAWVSVYADKGKIGKVDAKTDKVTMYDVPTPHSYPHRLIVDSEGIIWFGEHVPGKIGRFDPKTETFKEYVLPGPKATPYAIRMDQEKQIWYSSDDMDIVGRLDPSTGKVVEYPFPHSANAMREFLPDSRGRIWFGSPGNDRVGYFYLAGEK
jgi:virginiamycin B lyase